MKTTIMVVLLVCCSIVPCFSANVALTAQVNVVGDTKEYVYTLVNDVNPESKVYGFGIFMPAAGAQAVTDTWCSKSDWVVLTYLDGDYSYWSAGTRNGYLLPGESVVLKLTTNADVSTVNNFVPSGWPSNYKWFDTEAGPVFGNIIVPVPVPEPSSLMAIAGGITGLGGAVLKRRAK